MTQPPDRDDATPDETGRPLTPQQFEELFAANLHYVRAFVRLRIDPATRARESISDIVQSACREVLGNATFEYRGETAFRSYLCQAALHKLLARRRHYHAQKRGVDREQPDAPVDHSLAHVYRTSLFDPARRAMRAEEVRQLEAAFDQLPDDYREALSLHRIVGLPVAAIAERLGRTEGATRMLLSRAMARLSSILSREG